MLRPRSALRTWFTFYRFTAVYLILAVTAILLLLVTGTSVHIGRR